MIQIIFDLYRPVKQLMVYLESNGLFSSTQHGFRKYLSTETALLKITNEIYKNLDLKDISLNLM